MTKNNKKKFKLIFTMHNGDSSISLFNKSTMFLLTKNCYQIDYLTFPLQRRKIEYEWYLCIIDALYSDYEKHSKYNSLSWNDLLQLKDFKEKIANDKKE